MKIENLVNEFSSIDLDEMDEVSLMKRVDTKYILSKYQLPSLLERLRHQYKILDIENNRLMSYSNLYFDTEQNKFYIDHHNGKANRLKIRMRKYDDTGLQFLEVKKKDNKGNTTKSRLETEYIETKLNPSLMTFINEITDESFDLRPTLWNKFKRLTLVDLTNIERITIDIDLSFSKDENERNYDQLIIIEVKQEIFNRKSSVISELKSMGIHPINVSKYCIGMNSLNNGLKNNLFKRKLMKINQITAV